MMFSEARLIQGARIALEHLGEKLDAGFSVHLWDGTIIPLGPDADPACQLCINHPGVLGALMRRPSYEGLLRFYASGLIDYRGDTSGESLYEFIRVLRKKGKNKRTRELCKWLMFKALWPFLFAKSPPSAIGHQYASEASGRVEAKRSNMDFIQFHYDISNEFYSLFLDPEMQYSCGYFHSVDTSLATAQKDKLDHICRKLRLKSGEDYLDIGCGWGGLICHAAQHYGVKAHGVTLSQTQYDFAQAKVKRLGLEGRVTIELRDYSTLDGSYDKISSVGMFEHIGIQNMRAYFGKVNSLLRDRGIMMNHGIASRAKTNAKAVKRIRPERKLLLKYIFPGSELDSVGNTVNQLQINGFEVHDVEALREHYGLTCKAWHDRLVVKREEAIRIVGKEKYRMWLLYLAGVAIGFTDGSMHIFQVVASKHAAKGSAELPLTRDDLYRD
ncbi:MAG: cyclopropane-fatty-acyl-phospholipid synthase family protein [Mariprofundaceae bacterium]